MDDTLDRLGVPKEAIMASEIPDDYWPMLAKFEWISHEA